MSVGVTKLGLCPYTLRFLADEEAGEREYAEAMRNHCSAKYGRHHDLTHTWKERAYEHKCRARRLRGLATRIERKAGMGL